MLYLVISGAYMKVGFSANQKTLNKRLETYKLYNPSINIVGYCDGSLEDEREYHKMYTEIDDNYYKQCIGKEWGTFNEDVYVKFISEKTFTKIGGLDLKQQIIDVNNCKLETLDYYKAYTDIFRSMLRCGNMSFCLDVLNKMVAFEFSLNPPQQDAVNKLPEKLSPCIFDSVVYAKCLTIEPHEGGWIVGYFDDENLGGDKEIYKNNISVGKFDYDSWYLISHANSIEMAALRLYIYLSDNKLI